jgi:hypothetical protein
MDRAVGMFIKLTSESYLQKEGKYPPMVIPKDGRKEKKHMGFAALRYAIKHKLKVDSEEVKAKFPGAELTLEDWARINYKKWLDYAEFNSPLDNIKDVSIALEYDKIDPVVWKGDRFSRFKYVKGGDPGNIYRHNCLLWYIHEEGFAEKVKAKRRQFENGDVKFMKNQVCKLSLKSEDQKVKGRYTGSFSPYMRHFLSEARKNLPQLMKYVPG